MHPSQHSWTTQWLIVREPLKTTYTSQPSQPRCPVWARWKGLWVSPALTCTTKEEDLSPQWPLREVELTLKSRYSHICQKYSSKCTCTSFRHEIFSSFCHPLSSRQSSLKAQKEAKKSNVTVTMVYLGQGRRGSGGPGLTRDELKVLQQVNGGENICVFKDLVAPGGRSGEHSKLFCKNGQECAQKRSKGEKKMKPFSPHLTEAQDNRMKWEVLNVLPLFAHLITSALEATLSKGRWGRTVLKQNEKRELKGDLIPPRSQETRQVV